MLRITTTTVTGVLLTLAWVLHAGHARGAPEPTPLLELDAGEKSLGILEGAEDKTVTFRIKNAGTAPLNIGGARPSCPCVEATFSKTTLAPNEEATLTATYRHKPVAGALRYVIFISSNDPFRRTATAVLTGFVKGHEVVPPAVDLGKAAVSPPALRRVRVGLMGLEDASATIVGAPPAWLHFKHVGRKTDNVPVGATSAEVLTLTYELAFRPESAYDKGRLLANIEIDITSKGGKQRLVLPVTVDACDVGALANPSSIVFIPGSEGRPVMKSVEIVFRKAPVRLQVWPADADGARPLGPGVPIGPRKTVALGALEINLAPTDDRGTTWCGNFTLTGPPPEGSPCPPAVVVSGNSNDGAAMSAVVRLALHTPASARPATPGQAVYRTLHATVQRALKDMILVPGGDYPIGEKKEPTRIDAFYISKYVVSNELYDAFDPGHVKTYLADERLFAPQLTEPETTRLPAVFVNWYDAVRFCNWLSAEAGLEPCYDLNSWHCDFTKNGFRLPREHEWEAAARGPDGRIFPWGNDWPKDRKGNYGYSTIVRLPRLVPVDHVSEDVSPFGLVNMAGNEREWCYEKTVEGVRAIRGGAYLDGRNYIGWCLWMRIGGHAEMGVGTTGFRLARTPTERAK